MELRKRHGLRIRSDGRRTALALSGAALCLGLSGCLPEAGPQVVADASAATWSLGWLHGWLVPVNAVRSCFDSSVGIYTVQNTGCWYDFWFVAGWAGAAKFLGGLMGRSRKLAERLLGLGDKEEEAQVPPLLRGILLLVMLVLPVALVAALWWVNAGAVELLPSALAGHGTGTVWELARGTWHSIVCSISLVASVFFGDVGVVSVTDQGALYNLGWAFGGVSIGALFQLALLALMVFPRGAKEGSRGRRSGA